MEVEGTKGMEKSLIFFGGRGWYRGMEGPARMYCNEFLLAMGCGGLSSFAVCE